MDVESPPDFSPSTFSGCNSQDSRSSSSCALVLAVKDTFATPRRTRMKGGRNWSSPGEAETN
ncbi:unnamed protein product, partial [Nesidiocoris tenuis]